MAVKAIGIITDINWDQTGLTVFLEIHAEDTQHAEDLQCTGLNPSASDLSLDADIAAFVKDYAQNQFGITFGPLDTARVLFKINSISL